MTDAILHQGKFRGMTRDEAMKAWESKKKGQGKGKKKKKQGA